MNYQNFNSMNDISKNNIYLEKEDHIYKLEEDLDFDFTSVTTFVGQFFEEFDAKFVAQKLTSTHPKYKHMTVEELLGEWKKRADYGTYVHEEIENYINDKTEPKDRKSLRAVQWLNGYKMQSSFNLLSEKIIYSKELKLAGSIDLLLHDKKTDEYTIIDWKTSRKIDTSAFRHKTGNHEATRDLEDCNFNHYSLQLSLYRYILENYYNLKVRNQMIVHITDYDCRGYVTPYLLNHIKRMNNH
jgi:ATP-dependent exoDNAse (exonuclease V) beta subunit